MIYNNELRTVFKNAGIKKVAIVDDAFDQIDTGKVQRSDFVAVRTKVREMVGQKESEPFIKHLEKRLGRTHTEIFAQHDDEDMVEALWKEYSAEEAGSPLAELLAPMFRIIGVEKSDKLRPLRILKKMLIDEAKASVDEMDSTTRAADVVGYDLIFLDYYLGDEIPNGADAQVDEKLKIEARDRSINFLKELVELTQKDAKQRIPLVMLISSLAKPEHLPDFRSGAKMLASKMAFLPKEYAETNAARMQHTIIGLAQFRGQADALWAFLEEWKQSVDAAADDMMSSLRELDLPDYSYLQEYRLTAEKTPLSQYISSLFSGRLVDMVEREMEKRQASARLRELKLPQAIPGRVSPTAAITDLYSSLTTSQVPIAEGDFKPKAWAGDIFIDLATYNDAFGTTLAVKKKRKNMPSVLAVVTPACDLIPERSKENPLRMVTMVGGDLVALSDVDAPTTHLLMLNKKPYAIKWNTKWPFTVGIDSMKTTEALAGRYKWAARLRDLHHAELQHMLFADVGRVGVPVSPVMSEYVGVRILAKTGREEATDGYETVVDLDTGVQPAWTFATQKGRAFCLRDDLAWSVREWVQSRSEQFQSKKMTRLLEKSGQAGFLSDLHRPIIFKGTSSKASTPNTDAVVYLRCKSLSEIDLKKHNHDFIVAFVKAKTVEPELEQKFEIQPIDPTLVL
ncbi:hypothetical protein MYG64_35790 (plasmid) [Ensifer adhaerens]|uniref:hypothetical protein n=1 Tax=Ensifer adhaerens TaxID=106592 RepID=UPI002101556A|nr:hypothetical protein [Ensifer adhaerens]UTV41750.1 hypothetical protein MYG64_35790 [Ensifer adhaerens]